MNKMQKGFTLIELMIVVAIIAILAAIAIPAYQDYVIRSQVSEGASLAEGSKTAVAEYYSNVGRFPANNVSAGVAPSGSITGSYVTQVNIVGGRITVTFGNKANVNITAGGANALAFSPIGGGGSTLWNCTSTAGSSVNVKYRPTICRP